MDDTKEKVGLDFKYAECANFPDINFFSDVETHLEAAKAICNQCIIKQECLDYAISNGIEKGTWGGTSSMERTQIIRRWRRQQRAGNIVN